MHGETWFSISDIHLHKRNESGLSNEVFVGSLVMCRRGGAAPPQAPAPASSAQRLRMV